MRECFAVLLSLGLAVSVGPFAVGAESAPAGKAVGARPRLDPAKKPGETKKPQASAPVPGASLSERVDACVKTAMEKQRIPGLSLAVVKDGKVVLAKGYGLANVELSVPATPQTVYQIQSITKSFTATGIMMLVEEGKLGLDDKVGKHLQGAPETWKNVTLRRLLTHTSGIKDFINEPTASLRLDVTEEEVLKATAPRPLNFPPGDQYAYSNTNYHLLAMIIRKLTGKSYGDFLRQRIFEPLGMNHTRVVSLSEIIPNRAAGYRLDKDRLQNGEFVAPTILGYGGGGLLSTVLDLAKWDAALDSQNLLKRASLDQMWTPPKLASGKPTTYGLGWGVRAIRGHRCLSHTGGHVTGFATAICRFPDDKLTVIVLANLCGVSTARIAERIAALYVPDLGSTGVGRPASGVEQQLVDVDLRMDQGGVPHRRLDQVGMRQSPREVVSCQGWNAPVVGGRENKRRRNVVPGMGREYNTACARAGELEGGHHGSRYFRRHDPSV